MLLARSMLPVAALGVMLTAFPCGNLPAQQLLDGAGQRRAAENFLVQIRMSGGDLTSSRRSLAGVSPVRTPTRSRESRPASGPRRLRSMS